MKIALFGGTFDPIHDGHLDLIELARKECDLQQVILIPCAQSPFKTDRKTVATAEQRFQMIENAIAERDWQDWASVSRFEIDRPPPSFSWETAEHFSYEKGETAELFWILGTDQWDAINRWAEPEKLRELLTFIVLTRDNATVRDRKDWRHFPIEFQHPASSTAIRGGKGELDWIPESNRELVATIYNG